MARKFNPRVCRHWTLVACVRFVLRRAGTPLTKDAIVNYVSRLRTNVTRRAIGLAINHLCRRGEVITFLMCKKMPVLVRKR